MKIRIWPLVGAAVAVIAALPAAAQQPPVSAKTTVVKTNVDEVVLDFIARDKKGRPITDLSPDELSVTDDGARQQIASFRLVQGAEALSQGGKVTKLDPLRQVRLVTLAFEALDDATQRKTARSAAIDLVKGEQGANVFYSVLEINTRLLVLQPFTTDKQALIKAIDEATAGLSATRLVPDSERIKSDLKKYLKSQAEGAGTGAGLQVVQAKLASVMLGMLQMDAAMNQDARLSLGSLQSLVQGLQTMPGRKSVLYFSAGMLLTPELDAIFRNLTGMANRANVSFYSVDTRGVIAGYGANTSGLSTSAPDLTSTRQSNPAATPTDISTGAQNAGAMDQLGGAASAAGTSITRTSGGVTKEEMTASDTAENSARGNVQLPIRNLADATGGFLIGESNDMREPLRRVRDEIEGYYELTYDPHIQNYDGSFHKLKLDTNRKNVVLQARNGYFAMPPEARAAGIEAFELPLLKAISAAQMSHDVPFRAGAVLLEPEAAGRDVSVVVEVPLHGLQAKPGTNPNMFDVHFSLAALVTDAKGEVTGGKLSRDRSFHVTAEQLKLGNFVEKMPDELAPGNYTLETAVMDRESGKIGVERSPFTVPPHGKGVGISSLTPVRSYTPNAKNVDPNEPFLFQGGIITPTLNRSVERAPGSNLRLFFVVYADRSIAAKPTVEIAFMQNGKVLTQVPMPLPDADAQGRIPYVMTIPAAAIPPGVYQIRATAKQGDTESATETDVTIAAS